MLVDEKTRRFAFPERFGIRIDGDMRVRAAAGGVVEGLYAAGDICSGRFINMAGIKQQILNDMSFAVSSGFLAGTNAAEYVK